MVLDVFRCSQQFSNVFQLFSDDVFRLLKSSSSWTKLSMVGPQLFSGWYQMILDVFRCSQQFSNVFRLFSKCFPTMFSDCWILFKLNKIIYDGSSVVLEMILDDFRCFPMFSAVYRCFPTVFWLFSDDVFRLLKFSSSWTKLSMMGPQLFSGWYQMILDVFQCSQLFSNVFRLFSNCFPMMFSDCWNPLQAELNYLLWVLSCSQDDIW